MQKTILILFFFCFTEARSQINSPAPGTIGHFLTKAVEMESERKYGQALIFIDSAKAIDSTNSNIYNCEAEILWMMEDFPKAAKSYQTALLLDTDSSYLLGAYLFLGVLYEKAKMLTQAETQYQKAVNFFETKKHKLEKYFERTNKEDYALSLFLSGNINAWNKLIKEFPYKDWLKQYFGKSRKEVLEIYFAPYSAQDINSVEQGEKINGLKTGLWTEKSVDAYHTYTRTGNYKIIPLVKYDTIRKLGSNCYEINYKGSTPLLFYEKNVNGNISVKDSIWNASDSVGNIIRIDSWSEGLSLWTKYFNENGDLTEYDFHDYENDTSFHLTYINRRLFKKAFYPPENKNRQTKIYYPDNKLIISNAELSFTINFLTKPSAIEEISLSSKEDLTINSISSKRQFIKITSLTNKPITFPLRISPSSPIIIKIIATPTAATYQMTDTLLISTNESGTPYHIYSDIFAYHINGRTVEALTSIQLSRTNDKYLILPSMGTVTDATIISKNGESHYYEINGTTKIDLSVFPPGSYQLLISSCNNGGQLKFIITE